MPVLPVKKVTKGEKLPSIRSVLPENFSNASASSNPPNYLSASSVVADLFSNQNSGPVDNNNHTRASTVGKMVTSSGTQVSIRDHNPTNTVHQPFITGAQNSSNSNITSLNQGGQFGLPIFNPSRYQETPRAPSHFFSNQLGRIQNSNNNYHSNNDTNDGPQSGQENTDSGYSSNK